MQASDMGLIGLVTALKPAADGSPPDPLSILSTVMAMKQQQAAPTGTGGLPEGTAYGGPASAAMDAYRNYLAQGKSLPVGFTPSDLKTVFGDTLSAPAMASLQAAARATGIDPWQYISQGYRSYDQQVNAYNTKPNLAAPPGKSLHQLGLAMDTQNLPSLLSRWLLNNGWYQFDPQKEPWHYSYNWTG